MNEEKLGAQRARVFEGEIQRLTARCERQQKLLNHQGRALQAMGDALTQFALEHDRRLKALEVPAGRFARLRSWWQARIAALQADGWLEGNPEVDPAKVGDPALARSMDWLGALAKPQPGDEQLIDEVAGELLQERLARGQEQEAVAEVERRLAARVVEGPRNGGDGEPVAYRGRVVIE